MSSVKKILNIFNGKKIMPLSREPGKRNRLAAKMQGVRFSLEKDLEIVHMFKKNKPVMKKSVSWNPCLEDVREFYKDYPVCAEEV